MATQAVRSGLVPLPLSLERQGAAHTTAKLAVARQGAAPQAWRTQEARKAFGSRHAAGLGAACALLGRTARSRRERRRFRLQAKAAPEKLETPPEMTFSPDDPSVFTLGVLGDLHLDPRDLDHSFEGRQHMKEALGESVNPFLVSLGDLGESKDCTQTKQIFSGTTACFELARDFLDGFDVKYDIVGGNHDLEGIDEFQTDEANMEAYLRLMGKESAHFCHEVAERTLLVGLGSTSFRNAPYTSHEVYIDQEQLDWFEKVIREHPADDDWKVFVFTHAPIIGSGLRVLQQVHVVNGCCWLNHNHPDMAKKFGQIVRENDCIKGWFSAHFHLSHDYEDSITFPGGNNSGACVFAQTGVMTARSSRDGRRHSRIIRGNSEGFQVCTVDHSKGGVVRLDATVQYSDSCFVDGMEALEEGVAQCSTLVYAHPHVDYDHDLWFSAYTPQEDDGCYIQDVTGTLNPVGSEADFSKPDTVCWWHMKDGAVLGVHNSMVIEYDATSLAPLGMVVSKDEMQDRRVAVIDDEWGGNALVLYDDDTHQVTVVQPNEDGSYWRRVVRNKMHRMKEMRREAAAKNWMKEMRGEAEVLSSYGPYTTSAGQVMGITTRAINPKAVASK
mmetsp:Transcript_64610/g.140646  ORF Transcript_64610/g.140646 Transcript_64610/m.140646 type:complete len:613 (-) Transcript_64610:196-2034(-)